MRALALTALLASGCGLLGGGSDGGDGPDAPQDLATPPDIQPFDFAGAADGADLQLNPNRLDVTWRIFDALTHYVTCDDPRLGATTIVFTAVENANGAKAVTTFPCPAGQSQGDGFIDVTNNTGQFTVTAVATGTASTAGTAPITPFYGEAVSASLYLATDDMM